MSKTHDLSGRPIVKSAGCTFDEWMRRVNACVNHAIGLDADDLADWDYRSAYDDDATPSETARDVIASEMGGNE